MVWDDKIVVCKKLFLKGLENLKDLNQKVGLNSYNNSFVHNINCIKGGVMNKKLKLFFSFCVSILVVAVTFFSTGCSHSREVVRASKKLTNYTIDVNYCDQGKKISGSEIVSYINSTGQDLTFVCFNLYPTAFSSDAKIKPYTSVNFDKCFPNGESFGDIKIISVRVNETNATYSIVGEDNNALKVELGFTLHKNKRANIEIEFEVQLANCTHRLGFYDKTINCGNWYPVVAVFEMESLI